MLNPLQLVLAGLVFAKVIQQLWQILQVNRVWKNLKIPAKCSSGKGFCGRTDFFNNEETRLFYSNIAGNQTYLTYFVFWLIKMS